MADWLDKDGTPIPDNYSKNNIDGKYYLATDKDGNEFVLKGQTALAYGKLNPDCHEKLKSAIKEKIYNDLWGYPDIQVVTVLQKYDVKDINSPEAKTLIQFNDYSVTEEQLLKSYVNEYGLKGIKALDLDRPLSLEEKIKIATAKAKTENLSTSTQNKEKTR